MFDVSVLIPDFSLFFPPWISGFGAQTSSLGNWSAAGVRTRLLGTRLLYVSCNSAQLGPGWFESGLNCGAVVRGWEDISQPYQRGLLLGWVHC